MKNKLIILAGSSGSGKTTVAKKIAEKFKKSQVQILRLDHFYKPDNILKKLFKNKQPNHDHPLSFDWQLLKSVLRKLMSNQHANIPIYDYTTNTRTNKSIKIKPSKILILEGTLSLYDDVIRSWASLKVFVDTPLDECFIRRLERDVEERNRTRQSVIDKWHQTVRPMFFEFVWRESEMADIILPWYQTNPRGLKTLFSAMQSIIVKNKKG